MNFLWLKEGYVIGYPCIVFGFEDSVALGTANLAVSYLAPGRTTHHKNNLAIMGIDPDQGDFYTSLASLSYQKIVKGSAKDNTLRHVYPILNDPALPFRAGLTVHANRGSWSSLPHEFEAKEILDPRPMPFYEQFAYVTNPAGGQGVQLKIGHLFDDDTGYVSWVNQVITVRDRDITPIPLGSHPVAGGPGVVMMYFWLYWGSLVGREKF